VFIPTTAATAELTGSHCAATTVHWAMDSWMVAHATGGALMREGGATWFFVTADTALGHSIERDTADFVTAGGGRVLGSVAVPFAAADFTSAMERARGSGAKVVGLCNAGGDVEHAILAAHAQRLAESGARLAAMLVFISDIHALGLEAAQGLLLTATFYWDFDHRSRKLSRRLQPRIGDARIGMGQAGDYAGTLHYLKAVAAMGVAAARRSGAATVAQMSSMPMDDDAFGRGRIRQDGRVMHPVHLFQVKSPSESAGPWDYYRLLETVPSDKAARPLAAGMCRLVPH
jgi:branched-chain amino acid transport system substrate-binding protein